MIIHKELKDFKMYLMKKNKSKKTIVSYSDDIKFMLEFIEKPASEITLHDLYEYKQYMLSIFEISSINRKIIAINQFFKFLEMNLSLPSEKVQMQNFLQDLLTMEDINKMIYIAEKEKDFRFIALLQTLRLTGMRISECLSLKLSDIDKSTIMIIGKGNKRRNVFIPNKLKDYWNTYIQYRKNTSDKLFTGIRGTVTQSTVDKMFKKYGKMANIPKGRLHAHNLRHFYCVSLVENQVSIDTVADLVGHVSLDTTRIYTRKTKEQLLDLINSL